MALILLIHWYDYRTLPLWVTMKPTLGNIPVQYLGASSPAPKRDILQQIMGGWGSRSIKPGDQGPSPSSDLELAL